MKLDISVVRSADMTGAQAVEIADLCSPIFNCDYRALMDLAPVRTHVLGREDGRLVAHALWLDRSLRVGSGDWLDGAYVEGVATHPDCRRRGYGAAVMRQLHQGVAAYPLAALSPADDAVAWYEALGWERWKGPLFIAQDGAATSTPQEIVLIFRTPNTPALDLTAPLTAPWRPFAWW